MIYRLRYRGAIYVLADRAEMVLWAWSEAFGEVEWWEFDPEDRYPWLDEREVTAENYEKIYRDQDELSAYLMASPADKLDEAVEKQVAEDVASFRRREPDVARGSDYIAVTYSIVDVPTSRDEPLLYKHGLNSVDLSPSDEKIREAGEDIVIAWPGHPADGLPFRSKDAGWETIPRRFRFEDIERLVSG